MDKYTQVLMQLNKISVFRKGRTDLSNMIRMAELIGNPQDSMQFIHVAGTNGKGSVTLKMQKVLQQLGSCGCFTSPHLMSFRERIKINDQMINREYVADTLQSLYSIGKQHNLSLTFFEYITCLALLYYKESNVKYVAWETGLGGRLDATNIIKKPLLSIITSIGYDHMAVLGNTLDSIAYEKAGIIKDNCPVVLGPMAQPLDIFINECKINNAPYSIVTESGNNFNDENNNIVTQSKLLLEQYYNYQFQSIDQALQAKQMCRFEEVPNYLTSKLTTKNISIIMDVAHNITAIQKTLDMLKNRQIICVFGTSSQKDAQNILTLLEQQCQQVYLIEANHFRAMKIEQLIGHINHVPIIDNGNIESTIHSAISNCEDGQTLLVIGSFYIMREVRQCLGYIDQMDPIELCLRQ